MHLLAAGARPGEIAALTFSNRAAREMKERLDELKVEMERATRLQDAYHGIMKQPPSPYNRLFREAITFYSELRPGSLREERGADRSSLSMTQLEALKMVLGKEVAGHRLKNLLTRALGPSRPPAAFCQRRTSTT